ncbi:MAG: DUF1269 domain-containing protein [Anaerolineae bacterium]|nr:DUF1269 domain-containing protein [Anaerolineae bacterium]
MSTLIAVTYPNEQRAQEVLAELRRLESQYLIDLEDAVYVTKDSDGKPRLHQSVDLTQAGAVNGAFWGLLIGLLITLPFPFLAPLAWMGIAAATAGIGAAGGALLGKASDLGIDDAFMQNLTANMTPGTSTLFILARSVTYDRVEPDLAKFGGQLLYTNLNKEAEDKLRAQLGSGAQGTTSG